jgi:hypothetical protein
MRAPDQVVFTLLSPIMFTLLFRYVFGGAIKGLGDINYVNYLIPGIAVQTAIFTAGNSGFALAEDRGKGFIDRLRSLPMARSAVLTGRVAADTLSWSVWPWDSVRTASSGCCSGCCSCWPSPFRPASSSRWWGCTPATYRP